jgi:hypothetical protein
VLAPDGVYWKYFPLPEHGLGKFSLSMLLVVAFWVFWLEGSLQKVNGLLGPQQDFVVPLQLFPHSQWI